MVPAVKEFLVYQGRKPRCVNEGCQASTENKLHSPSNGARETSGEVDIEAEMRGERGHSLALKGPR